MTQGRVAGYLFLCFPLPLRGFQRKNYSYRDVWRWLLPWIFIHHHHHQDATSNTTNTTSSSSLWVEYKQTHLFIFKVFLLRETENALFCCMMMMIIIILACLSPLQSFSHVAVLPLPFTDRHTPAARRSPLCEEKDRFWLLPLLRGRVRKSSSSEQKCS